MPTGPFLLAQSHIYVTIIRRLSLYSKVHILQHLADSVCNLGPLWAHSAFPFEEMNGWLGDLFHGTRNPQKQVHVYLYKSLIPTFGKHTIMMTNKPEVGIKLL